MKLDEAMSLLADLIQRESMLISDLERLAECEAIATSTRCKLAEWAKGLNELHYASIGNIAPDVVWGIEDVTINGRQQ